MAMPSAVDLRPLAPVRQRLLTHPLYDALGSKRAVRIFARHHAFSVWDFQSLLTALQRQLTCVDVPWLPTPDPAARRLVNEIVLEEESDADGAGGFASHFELYLAAMADLGADREPVERLLELLRRGVPWWNALPDACPYPATARGVQLTLSLATDAPLHQLAAAFTLGREALLPDLFPRVLDRLASDDPAAFGRYRYYLQRHVELDGGDHGPAAMRLLESTVAGDADRAAEAVAVAHRCLDARLAVWDEILAEIEGG